MPLDDELILFLFISFFFSSLVKLTARLRGMKESDPESSVSFDKDDGETLDFVTATANLRAHVYGIEEKSRFDVKGTQQTLDLETAPF